MPGSDESTAPSAPSSTPAPSSPATSADAAPRAPWRPTRRQVIRTILYGGLAAFIAPPVWMRYIEPRWLDVTHRQVRLPGLAAPAGAAPLRLVHMSDFHASDFIPLNMISAAIDHVKALRPDLICVTGDFVTDETTSPDLAAYRDVLARLPALAPTYACLGNHDGIWDGGGGGYYRTVETIHRLLLDAHFQVLYNSAVRVEFNGRALQLVGLGDLWAKALDAAPTFAAAPASATAPTILLSHNPDSKDEVGAYPWHLMLSGHTHGGQLRVPFTGAAPFAPIRDLRYIAGLNPWNDRWIHTSRGVGNLHGMRFNCRPEITLLELLPSR